MNDRDCKPEENKDQEPWQALLEDPLAKEYIPLAGNPDCSPFFFYGRQQPLRAPAEDSKGTRMEVLAPIQRQFETGKCSYVLSLTPARLTDPDGVHRDYYAGQREEAILDALRLIARESTDYIQDGRHSFVGIRFTLADLKRKLATFGMKASPTQIRHSLLVLAKSHYELQRVQTSYGKNYLVSEPFLSALALPKHTRDHCYARLNTLMGNSLIHAAYRLSDYNTVYSFTSVATRKLFKILITMATGISHDAPYHILLTSFFSRSGLVRGDRLAVDAGRMRIALDELKRGDIIRHYLEDKKYSSTGQLEDYKYTLIPTPDFVSQVKLENYRAKERQNLLAASSGPYGSGRVR